jgi:amidophosphoribosyltransferase
MGVDMGTYDELIAHTMSIFEIGRLIGCDSLHYLSLDGMMQAIGKEDGYCQACFTGDYPIPVDLVHAKTGFEKNYAGAPGPNESNR